SKIARRSTITDLAKDGVGLGFRIITARQDQTLVLCGAFSASLVDGNNPMRNRARRDLDFDCVALADVDRQGNPRSRRTLSARRPRYLLSPDDDLRLSGHRRPCEARTHAECERQQEFLRSRYFHLVRLLYIRVFTALK